MWSICFADAKIVWKKHQFTFCKLKKPKPHDLTVLAYNLRLRNAWNIQISENVQIMNFQIFELTKSEVVRFYVFWAYKTRIQSVVLYKSEIDILLKIQHAEKTRNFTFRKLKKPNPYKFTFRKLKDLKVYDLNIFWKSVCFKHSLALVCKLKQSNHGVSAFSACKKWIGAFFRQF